MCEALTITLTMTHPNSFLQLGSVAECACRDRQLAHFAATSLHCPALGVSAAGREARDGRCPESGAFAAAGGRENLHAG